MLNYLRTLIFLMTTPHLPSVVMFIFVMFVTMRLRNSFPYVYVEAVITIITKQYYICEIT